MTHRGLLLMAVAVLAAGLAVAQDQGTGVGIIVGEPLGLSLKTWVDRDEAVDGGIGYSIEGDPSWQVHIDYLLHDFSVPDRLGFMGALYAGLGARINFSENKDNIFGVRVPFGVSFFLPHCDLFVELAPILDVAPEFGSEFNGGVGLRYFFP